jgi:rod shape determining protein RodA
MEVVLRHQWPERFSGGTSQGRLGDNAGKAFDWPFMGFVLVLLAIGLLAVYSASIGEAGRYWQKQLAFSGMGMVAVAFIYLIPPRLFYAIAYPMYILSLPPLLYIIIFKANSVERWIPLPGGFNFQPSEMMKVGFLLAMGRMLSVKSVTLARPKTLIAPTLLFIPPFLLVLNQPNLSTALSFVAMTTLMCYWSGLHVRDIFYLISPILSVALTYHHLAWGLMFLALILIMWVSRLNYRAMIFLLLLNIAAGYGSIYVWNKVLYEHQRSRIITFINPELDPLGAGYQVLQSKVAIGSGRLTGKGYLHGTQTNLSFLPEEHTDFIYSVIGEQFGFIGSLLVLVLFFGLIWRIIRMAREMKDPFISLVTIGVSGIFGFHILVNISMTIGLMPVTGLPLPFMSYGGSFLISCFVMLGILVNFRAHGRNL